MFKPTAALGISVRRTALTTKRGPKKGYYKGNRTGSMGSHTKWGGYKIDYGKVRTYVVPADLKSSPMTPFVDRRVERPQVDKEPTKMHLGQNFLNEWKLKNGNE